MIVVFQRLMVLITCFLLGACGDQDEPFEHVLEIGAPVGTLKYDTVAFRVSPGRNVKLTLSNDDEQPHNWVLCAGGRDGMVAVVEAALKLGSKAIEAQFIPEHANVLIASKLLAKGERQELAFRAPKKAGDYHYVCTFPGHAAVMRGVMTVK
jgi:azurin